MVVPGRKDWRSAVADTTLIDLVHRLAEGADRVVSVCAGAFVLAEAGLLNGRRVATHWEMAPQLAAAYADTRVEDNPIFIQDGHVITSAGVTAGIDLALHLVERDWGADVARGVARELVVFMARPGGQAQFSARLVTREPRHAAIRRVLDHVAADPAGEHTLDSLACAGGLSRRHLARLFRTEVGMTPGQYVESVRTEAARALLEGAPAPWRKWHSKRVSARRSRFAGCSSTLWACHRAPTGRGFAVRSRSPVSFRVLTRWEGLSRSPRVNSCRET